MITLDKPAFIATSEETHTSGKHSCLVVNFRSQLVVENPSEADPESKETSKKVGYIFGSLESEGGDQLIKKQIHIEDFEGKDILGALHSAFIAELSALNPKVKFTSTL